MKRVIAHPSFHNVGYRECEKLLENMDQGEAIIRPSSKVECYLYNEREREREREREARGERKRERVCVNNCCISNAFFAIRKMEPALSKIPLNFEDNIYNLHYCIY